MKKLVGYGSVVALAALLAGCVSPSSQGGRVIGLLYTGVSTPHWVTPNTGAAKSGKASATSILGIVAVGDASIQAAASNAGITKIHHVDQKVQSFLFFWGQYTVTVYGE